MFLLLNTIHCIYYTSTFSDAFAVGSLVTSVRRAERHFTEHHVSTPYDTALRTECENKGSHIIDFLSMQKGCPTNHLYKHITCDNTETVESSADCVACHLWRLHVIT
jgi:hypothetical protein